MTKNKIISTFALLSLIVNNYHLQAQNATQFKNCLYMLCEVAVNKEKPLKTLNGDFTYYLLKHDSVFESYIGKNFTEAFFRGPTAITTYREESKYIYVKRYNNNKEIKYEKDLVTHNLISMKIVLLKNMGYYASNIDSSVLLFLANYGNPKKISSGTFNDPHKHETIEYKSFLALLVRNEPYNWSSANDSCAKMGLGWRLPNKAELYQIYTNKDKFDVRQRYYWTNEQATYSYEKVTYWVLDFLNGTWVDLGSGMYGIGIAAVRNID